MAATSKAEYLKKYLSENAEEKKKRKKKKVPSSSAKVNRSRLVDDDIDLKSLLPENSDITLEDLDDNDPTIAEFIDERPEHVKQIERFRTSGAWKLMDQTGNSNEDNSPVRRTRHDSETDESPPRRKRHDSNSDQSPRRRKRHDSNSDQSPRRRKRHDSNSDQSPRRRKRHDSNSDQSPRRRKRHDSNSDQSPRRRKRHDSDSDQSPPKRKRHDLDSDQSPPRKKLGSNLKSIDKKHTQVPKSNKERKKSRFSDLEPGDRYSSNQNTHSDRHINQSRKRHDSDSDQSPPRRKRHDSDSDQSPPRKRKHAPDSDQSPPRRKRRDSSSDQSPPRRKRHDSDSDQSPPRRKKHNPESSETFQRKKRYDSDSDQSPPRKKSSNYDNRSKPFGARRRHNSDSDLSPPRRSHNKSASNEREKKTLGGKKAGLSSAKEMRREAQELRRKEEEKFNQISDEHLGRGAATVFRDRKSGRKRDLEDERRQEDEENQRKAKENEKYKQWGKGLKQSQQQSQKVEEALHEMNKPLARYKDDEDMDKMLREMTRAEDPMLAFIKKKKTNEDPKKEKPRYRGPAPPPNRFGIPPGYRWDGVDRSNGFEKKLFASQSESKATASAAYKWSVEDM